MKHSLNFNVYLLEKIEIVQTLLHILLLMEYHTMEIKKIWNN